MPWPSINPGRLVHRVELQKPAKLADAFGQTQESWSSVSSAWAAIDPVRGLDLIRSGQETNQQFVTITMWWQDGITNDMRVSTQNGKYLVQSIENPGERNVLLVLTCLGINQ